MENDAIKDRNDRYMVFKKFLLEKILDDEKNEKRRFVALVHKATTIADSLIRGNQVYRVDTSIPPFEMRYLRKGDTFVFLDTDDDGMNDKYRFPTIMIANNTPRQYANSSNAYLKVEMDIVEKSTLYIPEEIRGSYEPTNSLSENKVETKRDMSGVFSSSSTIG